MIRIFIENLLLFLAPTLAYVAYTFLRRRSVGDPNPVLNDAPLLWLFLAGVLLMVGMMVMFATNSGWKPGDAYQPPVYKDGRIEPGRVVR
jgi:hypothetical protein